jgi:hypothetical protein
LESESTTSDGVTHDITLFLETVFGNDGKMGQRDSKFGNRSIGNWVRVVKIVASSFYIFFCHIEVLLWIENSTNMSFRSKYKLQVNCWVFESFFIVINRFDALFQKSLRDVSDGPYNERCVIVSIHASPIIMALLIARACRSRFHH